MKNPSEDRALENDPVALQGYVEGIDVVLGAIEGNLRATPIATPRVRELQARALIVRRLVDAWAARAPAHDDVTDLVDRAVDIFEQSQAVRRTGPHWRS